MLCLSVTFSSSESSQWREVKRSLVDVRRSLAGWEVRIYWGHVRTYNTVSLYLMEFLASEGRLPQRQTMSKGNSFHFYDQCLFCFVFYENLERLFRQETDLICQLMVQFSWGVFWRRRWVGPVPFDELWCNQCSLDRWRGMRGKGEERERGVGGREMHHGRNRPVAVPLTFRQGMKTSSLFVLSSTPLLLAAVYNRAFYYQQPLPVFRIVSPHPHYSLLHKAPGFITARLSALKREDLWVQKLKEIFCLRL